MSIISWFDRFRRKTREEDTSLVIERHTVKVIELLNQAKEKSKFMVKTLDSTNKLSNDVRADPIIRERAKSIISVLREAQNLVQETISLSDVKRLDVAAFNRQMRNLGKNPTVVKYISTQVNKQARSIKQTERFIVRSIDNIIEQYEEFENFEYFRKIKSKTMLEVCTRSIITLYAYTAVVLHNIQLIKKEESLPIKSNDMDVIKALEAALVDLRRGLTYKEPLNRIKASAQLNVQKIEFAMKQPISNEVKVQARQIMAKIEYVLRIKNPYDLNTQEFVIIHYNILRAFKNRFTKQLQRAA